MARLRRTIAHRVSLRRTVVVACWTALLCSGLAPLARAQEPVADSFNPGSNCCVYALAVQPDGKIVVGGSFTRLRGGASGTTVRNGIGRLHPDGSLDTSFDPGADEPVLALSLQPDGKILVGGQFTTLGGGGTGTTPRNNIGRLNADGSLDTSFDPAADSLGLVYTLVVQPDGKILVGGAFNGLGGGTGATPRRNIGRLNSDGSLDTSFEPGANSLVRAVTLQSDGKIVVGGDFTSLGGGGIGTTTRYGIGRLNADGSLDASFNPGADGPVWAVTLQPDGKIVVGGEFTGLGGGTGTTPRSGIGRLNPGGSVDTSFNPGANSVVLAAAIQPDGKMVVGGWFTTLGGGGTGTVTRNRLGRLNPDGSLDAGFNPGANFDVFTLALQPDGRILAGGLFTRLGGGGTGTAERHVIGRLAGMDRLVVGLGPYANRGWIAARTGPGESFAPATWMQLPWPEYNATGGGLRVAAGDVDGDGLDEVVVGLGSGGGGWIAIFDDAAHDYALLKWIQVSWPTYNAANGEVWPAVGDLDGDGRAEIVAGLGPGGAGWFEVFDDAGGGFAHLAWRQVAWPAYNASGSGATHPAVGNVDGAGAAEIILGLGWRSDGWIEVVSGASGGYSHQAWVQVNWPSYNTTNGTTFPAAGDLDGDGRAEIVAGLGNGGGGWLEIFEDANSSFAHATWLRTSWTTYNESSSGETHPAVGNLDGDAPAEIVIGLDVYPGDGGWFEILDDGPTGYSRLGWRNLEWETFRAAGGATFPAIGRFR